jgi:hypothetical protein
MHNNLSEKELRSDTAWRARGAASVARCVASLEKEKLHSEGPAIVEWDAIT